MDIMHIVDSLVIIAASVAVVTLVYITLKRTRIAPPVTNPKDSPNPLFRMPLLEMEAYISSILVHELMFIIESDISTQDPNMADEIYGRLLVNVTAFFADSLDEFNARLGPNYLTNFISHAFHRLRINGELSKLISNTALR